MDKNMNRNWWKSKSSCSLGMLLFASLVSAGSFPGY